MFCFNCKCEGPRVEISKNGTMVKVKQVCANCKKNFTWNSQPLLLGKYPAGNILLSFATLATGASIAKVILLLKHMGICCYTARTFFLHQKKFLFPTILHYWEQYQARLVNDLKGMKRLIWGGDGRFDSMGHNAKYGIYSVFCSATLKIVHFELVQVCKILISHKNVSLK